MATRQIRRTDLVGVSSVTFIRPMNVRFNVTDTKPNTRLYAFFDGRAVDQFVTPDGGSLGSPIITSASGVASGIFSIPPMTFNTGTRIFRVQESPVFNDIDTAGSTIGSARAEFTTSAIRNTFRETVTTVNSVELNVIAAAPPPRRESRGGGGRARDPLAQSFFTYGVRGGLFISSIEVFFQTKDVNIPVSMEIRELTNGTPGATLASPFAVKSLIPSQVSTSNNATVPTKFTFPAPVYLPEDRDWCFVLLSNSNNYHVWTSRVGERSIETGKTIFEQPFIGSLFKSENNITWTAEQFEDIKFRINRAKFNTAGSQVLFRTKATPYLLPGSNFSVTSGSSTVRVAFEHRHGLRPSDYVSITGQTGSNYRGITTAQLTGNFQVTVIDEYTVTITAGGNATSTGTLETSGSINSVIVDSGGAGYTPGTAAVVFTGGGGTGAAATATIDSTGKVTAVTITNPGSGYTSVPVATLAVSGTTAASLTAISEGLFVIETNNMAHTFEPLLQTATVPGTSIDTYLKTTNSEYVQQSEVAIPLDSEFSNRQTNIAVSTINNTQYMPGQNPNELRLVLSSNNDRVSPVILRDELTKIRTTAYVINNQTSIETLTATASSGGVQGITVSAGGSGYGSTPTVTISAPDIAGGVQATATATLTTGSVSSITVNTAGSGYTRVPTVTISGGSPSTPAAAQAVLSPFNTELLARGGTAQSKYLTKPITLQTISRGARVYLNANSQSPCNIDVYIRTSLTSAGLTHTDLEWRRMTCDQERNLSRNDSDYLDYTFYLDGIPQFDVYDLKIVLRSTNKAIVPRIANYRAVILAT